MSKMQSLEGALFKSIPYKLHESSTFWFIDMPDYLALINDGSKAIKCGKD
jgi:hypothetical protein